jgi:hypothetical protein
MTAFLFQLLIALLVLGLVFYLIRWAVNALGLPQPIVVVVGILILIAFLYWVWGAFPIGAVPVRHLR